MRGQDTPIDWPALAGPVARALLGDPNPLLSRRTELRYGRHGSLSVDLTRGVWTDFEAGEGGGLLDLVMRERRCNCASALRWLDEQGWLNAHPPSPPPTPTPENPARAALVEAIWHAGGAADATPAHTYLTRRRVWPPPTLNIALPPSVRWLNATAAPPRDQTLDWYRLPRGSAGALLCAWTTPQTPTPPRAVSLEALSGDGERLGRRWRRTYGRRTGQTFTARTGAPSAHVHATEGELDALALAHTPWITPAPGRIIATGGTSGLRNPQSWATGPVTIHADGDPGGRAAVEHARHAINQRHPVEVVWYPIDTDPAAALADWLGERAALREFQGGEQRAEAELAVWHDLVQICEDQE